MGGAEKYVHNGNFSAFVEEEVLFSNAVPQDFQTQSRDLDVGKVRQYVDNISARIKRTGELAADHSEVVLLPQVKAKIKDKLQPAINVLKEELAVTVRPAIRDDITKLVEVDLTAFRSVYKHYNQTEDVLRRDLLEKFEARFQKVGPQWFTVLERNKEILGFIVACPTSKPPEAFVSWEDTTDNGTLESTYDPKGEFLYCVSLSVLSEGSRFNGQDMLMANLISKIIEGSYQAYFESRLPGLKRWVLAACRERNQALQELTEEDKHELALRYFEINNDGAPIDPLLRIYHQMGCSFVKLVPNAYQDELSLNYGVVAVYENPLPDYMQNIRVARKIASKAIEIVSRSPTLTQKAF